MTIRNRSFVLLSLLSAFLLNFLAIVVHGFPNEAGGCEGGIAAVAGRHTSVDRTRMVLTGELWDEKRPDLHLFLDGVNLREESFRTIEANKVHDVKVISSSIPFKGVLIRVEAMERNVDFSLTPKMNAQDASACSSYDGVVGVTHTNSNMKNEFSGEFFTDVVDKEFVLDVTVVDYNNSTGSVYWYSEFAVRTTAEDIETPSPTPAPTKNVENIPTIQTSQPTSTSLPTYNEPCLICGDDPWRNIDFQRNAERLVTILEMTMTCEDLVNSAPYIPPNICPEAQTIAELECGCVEETTTDENYSICHVCGGDESLAVTNMEGIVFVETSSVIATTCEEWQKEGLEANFDSTTCTDVQQEVLHHCDCRPKTQETSDTLSPTRSAIPTSSPYPTYSSKCNICGPNARVINLDLVVELDGGIGTCAMLEDDGAAGYISPEICSDAQQVAAQVCGCQEVDNVPSPSPSFDSFAPTITAYPSYSASCNICIEDGWRATNLDAEVTFAGDTGTCAELQDYSDRNLLPPDFCTEAQEIASVACGCIPIALTSAPTDDESCNLCPPGLHLKNEDNTVILDNVELTCRELQAASFNDLIPPDYCLPAIIEATAYCGECVPMEIEPTKAPVLTFTPTITAEPTITAVPTYASKCYVCGPEDRNDVDDDSAVVTVGNMELTCAELEEVGRRGILPPILCDEAMFVAAASCCGNDSVPAPSLAPASTITFEPTITSHPTITANPTYVECNICGNSAFMKVTNMDAPVTVDGLTLNCQTLSEFGMGGFIPTDLCPLAQQRALEVCGCSVSMPQSEPSSSPTKLPTVKIDFKSSGYLPGLIVPCLIVLVSLLIEAA